MKIRIFSDVHLEFDRGLKNPNQTLDKLIPGDEDVTVIAGDLDVGAMHVIKALVALRDKGFKNIVYTPGNHEYYHQDIEDVDARLEWKLKEEGIHYLNRRHVVIDGVTFIGAPLWANFNNEDPTTMWHCRRNISDFGLIKKGGFDFNPDMMLDEFHKNWDFIRHVEKEINGPKVIVTHFMPTFECVAQRYRGQNLINGYFATELGDRILEMNNVPLWIHGHTHDHVDVKLGDTRIVAHPLGYPGSREATNDRYIPFTVEI